jgi:quercetin dioxygenase-like cupin family protein
MKIFKNGSQKSISGPSDWFTGKVRVDPLFLNPEESSKATGAYVTFEPRARTAWHTHPVGQTLIVTFGIGKVQVEGGKIEEIKAGDVVWFSAGEKHWHGASDNSAMTHIAIQELKDGATVEWMEHVSDSQYEKDKI